MDRVRMVLTASRSRSSLTKAPGLIGDAPPYDARSAGQARTRFLRRDAAVTTPTPGSERSGARRPGEWIALGLQVLVGLFPYGASGLVAPPAGLAVLALVWLALFVALWRWRPANQWLALLVPVGAVALWYVVISLGEAIFGWTA